MTKTDINIKIISNFFFLSTNSALFFFSELYVPLISGRFRCRCNARIAVFVTRDVSRRWSSRLVFGQTSRNWLGSGPSTSQTTTRYHAKDHRPKHVCTIVPKMAVFIVQSDLQIGAECPHARPHCPQEMSRLLPGNAWVLHALHSLLWVLPIRQILCHKAQNHFSKYSFFFFVIYQIGPMLLWQTWWLIWPSTTLRRSTRRRNLFRTKKWNSRHLSF